MPAAAHDRPQPVRVHDASVDERWLREAFALAAKARRVGNRPFGAILVSGTGEVLGRAQNTQVTTSDCTRHAELSLIRTACPRQSRADLAAATLYASGEPCAMCAGAIFWSHIGRVVFGASAARLQALEGDVPDQLRLPCRDVLARGGRAVIVDGPLLEEEAMQVLEEYFRPSRGDGPTS